MLVSSKQPKFHRHSKLNSGKAILISTFNFSTLYTNIPHHELKSVMGKFINYCNVDDKESIGITKNGAIWTNSQEKYRLPFNKKSLKLTINYLLGNSHFTLGSMCFHQLTGIPMGSDPPSFMKNFYEVASSDPKKRDMQTRYA